MGIKIALGVSILLALGGAALFLSWWRQAERELDAAQAVIETMRAADAAGRDAVRDYVTMEKGAQDARKKGEQELGKLDGADDVDFWRGIERLLSPDADDRHHPAGGAADPVRRGGDKLGNAGCPAKQQQQAGGN